MKRNALILLFLMLLFSITTWADTVTIGTGVLTGRAPLDRYYNYSAYETLYLPGELGFTGDISGIAFDKASGTNVAGIQFVTIYMKVTPDVVFTTGAYSTTGYTQVFSGSFPNTATSGWMEATFPTPFVYNGSGSLAILIVKGYETWISSPAYPLWKYTSTTDTKTRFDYDDSIAPTDLTATTSRPNIRFTYINPTPMVFTSCTTTQNSALVWAGDTQQQVIGIPVVMTGGLLPLDLTQFTVNANGTTLASEISNAKIFYTGGTAVFSAVNQFGTTVAAPTTTNFTISGTQTLLAGTNYFWLTFDVSASAVLDHVIDAECTSLTIASVPRVPTVTAPAGNRLVKVPLTGIKTVGAGMTYTTLTDAINALNTLGVGAGGVTFNLTSGATFTEDPPVITATGAADRAIIFKKSSTAVVTIKPTGTAGTTDAGIAINGGDYITFDGISITINSGSAVEYGFYLYGGAQYNTIKNTTITLNKVNVLSKGIYTYSTATSAATANSYNKFYNITATNVNSGVYLNGSTTVGAEDIGNEVGVATGTNTITAFGTGTTDMYGIYAYSQVSSKIFSTTIMSPSSTTGNIYGIWTGGSATTIDIYSNMIRLFSSSGANIYGMYIAAGTTSNIYRNQIYDLATTAIGSYTSNGIYIAGGTTNNVYNNMIWNIKAVSSSATPGISGIYLSAGTTDNIFFNSVYLYETATGLNVSSAALYATTTPTTIDLRNNIFVNTSAVGTGGTGKAVAFWRNAAGYTNIAATTNNNLYYAGTPASQFLIHFDGTNSDATLGEYKTRIATRDQLSVTENVPWKGVASFQLHISATLATQVESGGVPVTTPFAILGDYDGSTGLNIRSATTPDIGADEGTFIITDLTPPVIGYTLLGNSSSTISRTLSGVTASDASGVNFTTGKPRVYFKKSTDANTMGVANNSTGNGWKWAETAGSASPFDLVIDYSKLQTPPAGGEIIQYFVVAQDLATTPNAGSVPGAGFVGTSVSAITSAPTTPNSFVIIASLSGIKTIGTGGNYATITAALAILNTAEIIGAVEYRLLDTSYASETFPLTITALNGASATNTITFKPAPGVSGVLIEGTNATAIWNLNGCSYVTIDGSNNGSTSKDLTIQNLSTAGPVINLIGASASNIVKNIQLNGCGTTVTSGVVYIGTTATGNGNSILDCNIAPTTTNPAYGVYIAGTFTGSQTVQGCYIESISSHGINLSNAASNGVLLQQNTFRNFGVYGIYLTTGSGVVVNKCEFYSTYPTASQITGIYVGNTPNAVVKKCKIHDLTGSASAALTGIYIFGASGVVENFQIYNNEIYLETAAASTTGMVKGIDYYAFSANSCEIYYNSVYIGGSNAAGGTSYAFLKRDAATTFRVENNIFMNARSNSTGTGKHYAVAVTNISTTTLVMNRNDYYVSGTGGVLGIWSSTDAVDLAAWQTASAQDGNSIATNPAFTFGVNYLRPYSYSPAFSAGLPITGITDDILDGARSLTTPTLGAFETGVAGGLLTVPINVAVKSDGDFFELTWDAVPYANGYKVYWAASPTAVSWTLLASPLENTYIDTNTTNQYRFYKVTATQ